MDRADAGIEPVEVIVLCDEFQNLAGPMFETVLSQCGKHNISIVAGCQSTTQLRTADRGDALANLIWENSATRIAFTCTVPEDYDAIQLQSMKVLRELGGRSSCGLESHRVTREVWEPRLHENTIREISARRGHFILMSDQGDQHREPMLGKVVYTLDQAEFNRLKTKPLPIIWPDEKVTPPKDDDKKLPQWKRFRNACMENPPESWSRMEELLRRLEDLYQ